MSAALVQSNVGGSATASVGGLLSVQTRRAASGSGGVMAAASTAAAPPAGFDSARMERFADRVGDRVGKQISDSGGSQGTGGGDVHIHAPNLKGVIGSGDMKKVFKQAARMVNNRQLTLKASDSLRVTRRSQ